MAAYWLLSGSQATRCVASSSTLQQVLAVLAVELLPEIEREHAPALVLVGAFALGSLFMYGLKLWTQRLEHQAELSGNLAGLNTGLLLATFIDVAVDGFIIGAGFAAGGETGTILALGLSVELLFLGLALTSKRLLGGALLPFQARLAARCSVPR